MRAPEAIYDIPMDLEYIWITHLPDFSIKKVEVESVSTGSNGDIIIKVIDSPIWGNSIRAKKGGHDKKTWWLMKKSYHLSEGAAALRLREHYRKMNTDNINDTTSRVIADTSDKELMYANIEKYVFNYPEMTI